MGSDDFDYSYYRDLRSSRGGQPEQPKRERKPSGLFLFKRQQPSTGDFSTSVKWILARDPDLSVDEIIQRLNTDALVSKVAVSAIKTEFRHSLKVVRDAGLLK